MNLQAVIDNLNINEKDRFFSDSIIPKIVTSAVRNSNKSQVEIANELNINANLITMFKQGRTKVPLARAADFARSLNLPVHDFVRLTLTEYHPEIIYSIEENFVLSTSEEENKAFGRARDKLNK